MKTMSFDFRCTPEQLWPWLTELERQKQWMKGLLESELVEGDGGAGSKIRMKIKEGGRVAEYDGRLTAFEPAKELALDMTGGCFKEGQSFSIVYRLHRLGDGGTRLDIGSDANGMSGVTWRLFGRLFMWLGKMQLKRHMKTLKRLAETPERQVA